MMRETGADTVISVVKVEDGGPGILYWRDDAGGLKPYASSPRQGMLRQQASQLYARSGSVYLMRRDVVVEQRALYGRDVRGYVCPPDTASISTRHLIGSSLRPGSPGRRANVTEIPRTDTGGAILRLSGSEA